MDSLTLLRRLDEHRRWSNRRLFDAAAALEPHRLHQSCEIGQGTIWKSLLHMYAAEYVWLGALQGNPDPRTPGDEPGPPGNQRAPDGMRTMQELAERWEELEGRWTEYFALLRPEHLDQLVYKITSRPGAERSLRTRCADVLLHVHLHAHYTSAQLINMLRQVGADGLPEIMLITLARDEFNQLLA